MDRNNSPKYEIGDRVVVSAACTGTGENMSGVIFGIEEFAKKTFISISYDRPTIIGDRGVCVTNLGLITKIN